MSEVGWGVPGDRRRQIFFEIRVIGLGNPFIFCRILSNIPKNFPPAAGFKHINKLYLLVNISKNFRLRRASLLMFIFAYVQGECIEFARRRRENFGYTDLYTKGNV